MAVTIDWTLAYNPTGTSGFQGGANILGNRLLGFRKNREVHRSADGGATWASLGTVGGAGFVMSRPISLGLDECLVTVSGDTGATIKTYRTTDGGDSWTEVDSLAQTSGTLTYGFVQIAATDEVLQYGFYDPLGVGGAGHHFRRSLDRGATWAAGVRVDAVMEGSPLVSAAYVNGVVLAGEGATSTARVWRSTASPWTAWTGVTLPGTITGSNRNVWALAPVTGDIVLASGGFINDDDIGANPTAQVLWLWRTADAGATWARVANANILNAPTDNVAAGHILKISDTVQVVGYGYQDQPHATAPGWRATDDAGLTLNVVNTADDPPDGTFYTPAQMVLSDAGVIVSFAALDEGANGNGEIWLGVVSGLSPCDDTLTDADLISFRWDAGDRQLVNEVVAELDHDAVTDTFAKMLIFRHEASIRRYGPRPPIRIQSQGLRTDLGADAFLETRAREIFQRFGDAPPAVVQAEVFYRKGIAWEAGDIICLTSAFIPNLLSGGRGLTDEPFELVDYRPQFADRGRLVCTLLDIEAITPVAPFAGDVGILEPTAIFAPLTALSLAGVALSTEAA